MILANLKIPAYPLFKERAALAAVILCMGIVFFVAFYMPVNKKVAGINSNIGGLRAEISRNLAVVTAGGTQAERLEEAKRGQQLLENRLGSARKVMPAEADLPAIIRKAASPWPGLLFLSISPAPAVDRGAYIVQPLTLQVRGRFPVIGGYISMLEGFGRFMRIDGISIEKDDKEGLLANLKLTIYALAGD